MRVKMSKQPLPAPTASAVGPCRTVIQIVGRPGTGSLPSTIAPPDHPLHLRKTMTVHASCAGYKYKVRITTMRVVWTCFLSSIIFALLSPSLWETA